ncbi:methylthioribose-1-phosphate isomerase-like protein [Leptotrombidium deliense]|uniref:Methylthioribose-1-phosphate isomerase n=1 Tax=Leptotrombidium deliense TaxID=299467 RepID=A0A443SSE9_9ACAR|nr:methylthioribose-1-phosphate isomerase-like protein [Leptotrombidium deliense]
MLESIIYQNGELKILDQLRVPKETIYLCVSNTDEAWIAIKRMNVRGAPAIAIVGLLSLCVEFSDIDSLLASKRLKERTKEAFVQYVKNRCDHLCTARPTAVNIAKECRRIVDHCNKIKNDENVSFDDMLLILKQNIESLYEMDVSINKMIGERGAMHIVTTSPKEPLNILTHCNTGSLATAGYGTALGVIRFLHSKGKLKRAFCTETRPFNQGSRLTAYELVQEKIPGTLICDSMVAALMKKEKIAAVVVGADRVVSNGDTANKIGTYQIAVIAKHHNVPFYVAAPLSSIDFNTSDGSKIPIEERPSHEIKFVEETQIAPKEIVCWNPAFDVTPADLISGIITEVGVFKPHEMGSLHQYQQALNDALNI